MKRIKRAIAKLVIVTCDAAIGAINKALRLPPVLSSAIPSRDREGADPPPSRPSPLAALGAPWPPGLDHRSIFEGKRLTYFMLRPGASTPPEIYLAYWKKRINRKARICVN